MIASFLTNNYKNYHNKNDELRLFPHIFNFQFADTSYLTEFFYLKDSSFIKFFINNLIDVPVCFKKSNSLKTKNFELPLLKFSNFLMKKGKKEKTFRLIFNAFRSFFKNIKIQDIKPNQNFFS